MLTGGGHPHCPLDVLLAYDVGEVGSVVGGYEMVLPLLMSHVRQGQTRMSALHRPRPILQRLGQMRRGDVLATGQVGNCPADLQHAVEPPRAQAHLGHSAFH